MVCEGPFAVEDCCYHSRAEVTGEVGGDCYVGVGPDLLIGVSKQSGSVETIWYLHLRHMPIQ